MNQDIFSYIKTEESRYDTEEIQLSSNWNWSMKSHLMMSFNFIHGIFNTGENNWTRPFKKIIQPILNFRYAAEDIEVKDILLYVEDEQAEHLSFLIKKYHDEVYVKENNLDEFIDDANESDIDYGGVLVQKTSEPKPEVLNLHSIAFCDQTNILGGPIGFKNYFSPDKLRQMTKFGWGEKSNGANTTIEDLIKKADFDKDSNAPLGTKQNTTTGKNIEVYIVRGEMPESFLKEGGSDDIYVAQIQIVAFYETKDNKEDHAILYRKEEKNSPLKFNTSNKKIYSRALGTGGAEDLFQPQIWTNFLEIHKMNLLEAGSKVPLFTDDPAYQNRNKIKDMENLEITTISPESKYGIRQVPTAAPANVSLMERTINEFYENAQQIASAFDPLLGQPAPSGTPFRSQERQVIQGRGPHDRRRGKFAKFIEEIYRDWIIPHIAREILKGKEFLATLSSDEMQWISQRLAENYANKQITEAIIDGKQPQDRELLKLQFLTEFTKKGNKHFLKILKEDFKDKKIMVSVVVAKKQKDLAELTDKLVNIVRQIIAAPQILQDPLMRKLFDKILMASGLDPVDFQTMQPMMQPQMTMGQPQAGQPAQPPQMAQMSEV